MEKINNELVEILLAVTLRKKTKENYIESTRPNFPMAACKSENILSEKRNQKKRKGERRAKKMECVLLTFDKTFWGDLFFRCQEIRSEDRACICMDRMGFDENFRTSSCTLVLRASSLERKRSMSHKGITFQSASCSFVLLSFNRFVARVVVYRT